MSNGQILGQGIIIGSFASDPTPPTEGMIYYNSVVKKLKLFNGTAWEEIPTTNAFANTALNNLTFTSINEDLNPADNTKNLGTMAIPWSSVHVNRVVGGNNTVYTVNFTADHILGSDVLLNVTNIHQLKVGAQITSPWLPFGTTIELITGFNVKVSSLATANDIGTSVSAETNYSLQLSSIDGSYIGNIAIAAWSNNSVVGNIDLFAGSKDSGVSGSINLWAGTNEATFGDISLNANVINLNSVSEVRVRGNLMPSTTLSWDLGADSNTWKDSYFQGISTVNTVKYKDFNTNTGMTEKFIDGISLAAFTVTPTEITDLTTLASSMSSMIIQYCLIEDGTGKTRTGHIYISYNSVTQVVSCVDNFSETEILGIGNGLSFSAVQVTGNIKVLYNNTQNTFPTRMMAKKIVFPSV